MNTIITKTTSRNTIEEVIQYMSEVLSPAWYRLSRHRFNNEPDPDSRVIIRWGCTASTDTNPDIIYNRADKIRLVSNKKRCREYLYERGIPTPEPVGTICATDFPIVVRPAFHQKGKDFLLFNNLTELLRNRDKVTSMENPYYSKFYPKTTEYRVHVAHGKVLIVQQKVQTSDTNGENWSHDNGYTFEVVPWKQYRKDIVSLAVKTIEVLGMDFGAVDIMADPLNSRLPIAVVCEVNTSPRLEGYTAERYAEYFDWLLRTRETRHVTIPDETEPRHYVWKHRELKELNYDFEFKTETSINF